MTTTSTTTNDKNRKKPTLAQTIDQVMTIKTHTESSKTELSSRGKRPFKVSQNKISVVLAVMERGHHLAALLQSVLDPPARHAHGVGWVLHVDDVLEAAGQPEATPARVGHLR